ncbi:MAG: pyridine nucleotide-disulfide oxidoreductase [Firmicutes bacterium GWF2_51_9]|nr:MAG: pyridine nucleotide-disulfide oxidoreductase [Firmicutes bacterium GWF2_51_9]OGS57435.1 MAG: pyridine nucleotide-disulfide oxidoreductase [Firmicutes bacterium GWE2_51_13]HAM63176.1 pyridine nucleotide-disulfide oxidoreductase [Erysipelotrichaceae bacterium]
MRTIELVIIGGGSAGLASAISAYEHGIKDILILERDKELGGILQQCIHNGFGLHTFKEELSGPAYAERYIDKINEYKIEVKLNAMVTHLSKDRIIEYVTPDEGYVTLQAKAVILAMGCRERTRGAIAIPGYRPAGIWSAGTAQRYLNMEGYMVGKRIFILGSGDIGLIMARRMTLEGAKVLGVAEIMPYSNGLPRNIKQCLEDFDIPLYLSHTITRIEGKDRVNQITIQKVDERFQAIANTELTFDVDTVLFSVGLIPENALSEEADVTLHQKTKGPIVDETYQTDVPGIFACGNVLHVHDLVDWVSLEGQKAGISAARYLNHEVTSGKTIQMVAGEGLGYIVPHHINPSNVEKSIECMFRVTKTAKFVELVVKRDGQVLKRIKKRHLAPAEMERIVLTKDELMGCNESIRIEIGEVTL